MSDLYSQIKHLHPCSDAVEWLGNRTLEQAWTKCERGDWMLWLAGCAGVKRKLIVLAACDCVEAALEFVESAEAETAIKITRLWCEGKARSTEVEAAADAADADNGADLDAVLAANAAAMAADSTAYTTSAMYAPIYAADAVAYNAVSPAAYAAAYVASLKRSADIVRAKIPVEVVREALKGERDE